ncbi:hypothetical protein DdX_18672 [Ditylenchus destructor]|uniref:F-box domain-containing protein n=1 Tax=Ditylenchus destructor TaxID=166010 RepID=A0AAD4QSQ1_9BILA|nr:hypothetical protein DdX_18672 [Ditylenchus destructor]
MGDELSQVMNCPGDELSQAKKRMEETLKNEDEFQQEVQQLRSATLDIGMLDGLKKRMSLERFDDRTFLRVLTALVAMPKFRQKFDVSYYSGLEIIKLAHHLIINQHILFRYRCSTSRMSSLPNEIFSDITNFLPNDDITDLMLMSRTFKTLVTPRLQKINQEMTTMDQSIESFMPTPAPDFTDHEWIVQLNLKKFEPIGSEAKKRMKDAFEDEDEILDHLRDATLNTGMLDELKARVSLERFDDKTFLRILSAFILVPKFREEYNISEFKGRVIVCTAIPLMVGQPLNVEAYEDLRRISKFYKNSL